MIFLKETGSNLSPLPPNPLTAIPEILGSAYGGIKFSQAMNYAASRPSTVLKIPGLPSPYHSSTFRGILADVPKGAMGGFLGSLDVAMLQAFVTEFKAWDDGKCQ
jgi:hypothetical protein